MSDAMITLQPTTVLNDLILEAFETKDIELVKGKLKDYALSVGYDMDNMYENGAPPVIDINMYVFETVLGLCFGAIGAKKLGEIKTQTMTAGDDYNIKLVKYLRICGMTGASQDPLQLTVYYTSPVLAPRLFADPLFKEDVLNMIALNNQPPKPIDNTETVFGPEYTKSLDINRELQAMKDHMLSMAKTAKDLKDIFYLISYVDNQMGDECVQWLKDCGFEQARYVLSSDGMMMEVRLV